MLRYFISFDSSIYLSAFSNISTMIIICKEGTQLFPVVQARRFVGACRHLRGSRQIAKGKQVNKSNG